MSVLDFFKNHWDLILSLVLVLASAIFGCLKSSKSTNRKGILVLLSMIPSLVIQAEEMFGKGHGTAKLNYVLTELRVYAIEHGIKVENAFLVDNINSVVASTNQVNTEKKPIKNDEKSTDGQDTENCNVSTEDNLNI